jgi:hypothetical protein
MDMRPSGKGFNYTTCNSDESKPSHSTLPRTPTPPPCIEPLLTDTVQSAFNSTMNCLGLDQKEIFSLIGWESHFQINLYNSGGTGIGQVTGHATSDVDLNHRFAEDLYKPECQQFASIFDDSAKQCRSMRERHLSYIPLTNSRVCEWIASSNNPARNLLYAGATYRLDKREAERLAARIGATPADREKIATEIARYMYNGGSGAIRNLILLKYGLRSKGQRVKYSEFKSEFHDVVLNYFGDTAEQEGDPKTKARVASYTHDIDNHARRVEKATGGAKCSEQL